MSEMDIVKMSHSWNTFRRIPADFATGTQSRLSVIDVILRPAGILAAISEEFAYVRSADISPDHTVFQGTGLSAFLVGDNSFTVSFFDNRGTVAESAVLEDLVITATTFARSLHYPLPVKLTVLSPGVFGVEYVVTDLATVRVVLDITVAGKELPPRTAYGGYNCRGNHLSTITIPLAAGGNNRGIACTADGAHIIVADMANNRIHVVDSVTGAAVRDFGGAGTGPCQFNGPCRLSMTPSGNILVADLKNLRVQEVTIMGEHVCTIDIGDFVGAVDCNESIIVVGKSTTSATSLRVEVFNAVTKSPISQFGRMGNTEGMVGNCNGIRISPAGDTLLYCENENNRISMFKVDGTFLRTMGAGIMGFAFDALFTLTGDVVAVDGNKNRVAVFDGTTGNTIKMWGRLGNTDGSFNCPAAMCVLRNNLLVMDNKSLRIQMFD
jgi:hypothetical protein